MKKFRLFGVLLSAVMFASCSGNAAEQEVTETASESTVTTSETTAETTTEQVTEATETEAEEVPQAAEDKYVQVSPDTEFIDYEFIEDYQGTTDIGDLADKAVEFLKESEYYAESMENIAEFKDEEFSEYIRDGVIVPKFSIAYPNDYDGDGKTETFIMVDIPYYLNDFRPVIRNILIFADNGDKMEAIGDYSYFNSDTDVALLNYGKYKQIIFGGDGACGADMHAILYGVNDGKAVEHFGVRGRFEKENCFLKVYEYYSSSCFLYCFDAFENEYRDIVDIPVSIAEMKPIQK